MKARWMFAAALIGNTSAFAQDVPGIEICTVDKTMERRTSCLQSNVDFLVKTINRLKTDQDQRLGAALREIAALKTSVADLQKTVTELQPARAKVDEPPKPQLPKSELPKSELPKSQPPAPASPGGAAK